jgi:hypothetical protein
MEIQAFNRHRGAFTGKRALLILQTAAIIMFASGCGNGVFDLKKRDDLGAKPDSARATGIAQDFVSFAQFSDVHIVDDGNPLRFENIKMGSSTHGELDSLVQMISRNQDRYSARIWDAVVRSINEKHAADPVDFAISTGDHTDTGLKTELRWFIEIADGIKSESLQDAILRGTMVDLEPAGFQMPWYAAIGNHDVEYQGTLNGYNLTKSLLSPYGDISDLSRLPETVDLYADSLTGPWWHGFDSQPAGSREHSYGYYSFNPNDLVHCIVLDTAIYNLEGKLPVETLAGGVLDRAQYNWMVNEINANRDRICIIFSHHTPLGSFADGISQISAAKFRKTLCSYENVVAHVNGHTHVNEITAVMYDSLPGGYWNINTSSIIEWPQEWRDITVKDNGDGTGTITCQMVQHSDTECLDVTGGDPDAKKPKREGMEKDRNVELKFRIPVAVKDHILGL